MLVRLASLVPVLVAAGVAAAQAPQDRGAASAAPRRAPIPIARALESAPPASDTMTIAGRATASHGQLQRSALEISVDDGTGAIRVFSRSLDVPIRTGDSVIATGNVRGYRGSLELFATAVRVVPGERRVVPPIPLSLEGRVGKDVEGRLVRVVGAVTGYGRSEGGEWLRLRGTRPSDVGSITVWVHANHGGGVRLAPMREADSISVTGIVIAFQDNPEDAVVWQVVPRTGQDVVRIGHNQWIGSVGWVLGTIVAIVGLGLLAVRVGSRRHARALRETEDRYRQLLDLSPDAVIVHEGGRILFANPAAARMLALPREEELVGRQIGEFADAESPAVFVAEPAPGDEGADAVQRARGRVRTALGGVVDVEVTSSPCRYHDHAATVVLARDVTQQLRVERDLRSLALLDDLTGLHNRRGFMLFADQELARARRYGREAALVFADLDDLKVVNDEHGHAAGDLALRVMANALRSVVRESDIVARWSGDEFVVLLLESSAVSVEQFAERLRSALASQSVSLPFVVSASVGTATLDDGIADALERADAALYQAKSARVRPAGA
jgi:diguanylate cyclase (GGDEF)-like protein/PAS domain S-box-containing protein